VSRVNPNCLTKRGTEHSLKLQSLEEYPDSGEREYRQLRTEDLKDLAAPSLHFSSGGTGLLVTGARYPFAWVAIASHEQTGRIAGRPSLMPDLATKQPSSEYQTWFSLPVVRVGTGHFLQTLFDPRSDYRLLVLYDSEGRVQRERVVQTAIGIMAAAPTEPLVIALRRTDRTEVVTYRVLVKGGRE
jgi:hypothetical protein